MVSAYREEVAQVIAALGTDARSGLTTAEARSRLVGNGKNELTAKKAAPQWRKFLPAPRGRRDAGLGERHRVG